MPDLVGFLCLSSYIHFVTSHHTKKNNPFFYSCFSISFFPSKINITDTVVYTRQPSAIITMQMRTAIITNKGVILRPSATLKLNYQHFFYYSNMWRIDRHRKKNPKIESRQKIWNLVVGVARALIVSFHYSPSSINTWLLYTFQQKNISSLLCNIPLSTKRKKETPSVTLFRPMHSEAKRDMFFFLSPPAVWTVS